MKDRVNLSDSSDIDKPQSAIDLDSFLMKTEEWDRFKEDCCVLVSRYAPKY